MLDTAMLFSELLLVFIRVLRSLYSVLCRNGHEPLYVAPVSCLIRIRGGFRLQFVWSVWLRGSGLPAKRLQIL